MFVGLNPLKNSWDFFITIFNQILIFYDGVRDFNDVNDYGDDDETYL
jgi:hypothetical protein